jgi:hypothetical protein
MEIPVPKGEENVFLATRVVSFPDVASIIGARKKMQQGKISPSRQAGCRGRATKSDNATKTGQCEKLDARRHATPSPK